MLENSKHLLDRWFSVGCAILLLLLNSHDLLFAQQQTQAFESPPILKAQQLAPASLLSGTSFHVDDDVPTDGLTANYTIHTDLGALQAHGLEMLRIRIAEVPAMIELQNTCPLSKLDPRDAPRS